MPDRAATPRNITVDFSGVEIRRGGGGIQVPEGDYLLRVTGCERRAKKDDASRFYLLWKLEIAKPTPMAGKGPIYHRTSLSQESLWALRTFLVDLLGEKNVPESSVTIPIAQIVQKKPFIGATLKDGEPYNGKVKSEIAATFSRRDYEELAAPDAEEEEETEEDEAPAPKPKAAAAKKPAAKAAPVAALDEEEEEEEEEEIDIEDL
jgi:hypothetical protein